MSKDDVVMETLTCETCEKDWEREQKRGRKPKTCPECKIKEEEEREAALKESDGRRVRRSFKNKYTVIEGEVKEGEMALFLLPAFLSSKNLMDYGAKEFKVVKIDQDSDTAWVEKGKEIITTRLSKLHPYEMERIEVEDRDEEIYTEQDLDTELLGDEYF